MNEFHGGKWVLDLNKIELLTFHSRKGSVAADMFS